MKNYIQLEIRLLYRSKRIRQIFILAIYFILFFYSQLIISNEFLVASFYFKIIYLLLLIAFPGTVLAQYFFSIEANFINKLITIPTNFHIILTQKYFLYCLISLIMFILLTPSMLWGIKLMELLSSLFMAIGPFLFIGFQVAKLNDRKLDLNARNFMNWQGNNMSQYILSCLLFTLVCLVLLGFTFFLNEKEILLSMFIIGLIFVVLYKIWLANLTKYYDNNIQSKIENLK